MPGVYLYGWDSVGEIWVKIECTAAGIIKIDPALLLENPPTEDESTKAPTSEWAFDHNANVAAHHAKYTDANSRAAINDIFGADGKADKDIEMDGNDLNYLKNLRYLDIDGGGGWILARYRSNGTRLQFHAYDSLGSLVTMKLQYYDGAVYRTVAHNVGVDNKITTHAAIASAHHTKYTDANAQAACNLARIR